MFDAILISPHYDYTPEGQPIPGPDTGEVQDLSMIIPLGIIHIAQYLHDRGLNVRVVHLPHEMQALQRLGLSIDTLNNPIETVLTHYPARVCGIQSHFYLYTAGAARIADIYRHLFPDSTILAGGYMASACWQEILTAVPSIDGVVLGEGEKTIETIVAKAKTPNHGFLNTVPGVASRDPGGGPVCNPPRPENLLALDEMPVINPDAPPFGRVAWSRRSFMNISRGLCPQTCAFCVANNRTINPRAFQTMTIDRILEQLNVYRAHGIQSVFLGENHFLDTAFMRELIEGIMGENLDMAFELETHPVLFADKNLLRKMVAAGFYRFTMGCESGSNAVLQRVGRQAPTRRFLQSVKAVADAGALAVTSWICNLPGETADEFEETQEMLRQVVAAGGFIYWIENLHLLPGSALHCHPEKWRIKLLLNDLEDWFRWSLDSKTYVDPDDALRSPRRYLTHLNHNTGAREMMKRFFDHRRLARRLVPDMQRNLAERAPRLPPELVRAEMQTLDWYQARGWQLLLF